MSLDVCFSHNSDDWRTPSDMFARFMRKRFIDCFPFHAKYDEFLRTYTNEKLFVNPPYSKLRFIPEWIKRQVDHGCIVVLLIPARTDTVYFHELLKLKPRIEFIKGRLHFNDSKSSAPFPSLLLEFRKDYL